MEYSIHELSHLSGVTTRTLRWYDKIGLLKPSRTAESGYRFYGPAEVDRLQDILYYRALGVELAQIRAALDDPAFDRLSALRGHLTTLQTQRDHLDRLIKSVQTTIRSEERNEIMNDNEKFEVFKRQSVEANERTYGEETRAKYGDAQVDAANAAVLSLTREQYQQWNALGEQIQEKLEAAVRSGVSPTGDEGREITDLHRRWLTVTIKNYDANQHKGIAALYVADQRFTAYYDKNTSGCARFLCDAVQHWAK